MITAAIVTVAGCLLAGLLYYEKTERLPGKLLTKTPLSLLFIVAALAQGQGLSVYTGSMLAGLVLCLGGDVLLAVPGPKTFRAGLVSFLGGHLFYIVAFLGLSPVGAATWVIGGCVAAAGWVTYRWLQPHLGSMRIPVVVYIVVISAMLCSATAVGADAALNGSGRIMVLIGALFFYISDIFVARHRFISAGFVNRLAGLPLYYTGQFLLAFSLGALP